jgi:hypothetical protein
MSATVSWQESVLKLKKYSKKLNWPFYMFRLGETSPKAKKAKQEEGNREHRNDWREIGFDRRILMKNAQDFKTYRTMK